MNEWIPGAVAAAALVLTSAVLLAQATGSGAPAGGADGVIYMPAEKIDAAFAKGSPILETGTFKILAGRRDKDGQPEVHARDTDIFHVLEGTATLVTGGSVTGGKNISADEIRGDTIEAGTPHKLAKGDVIVIPSGVPHQLKDVRPPFLYYVVKVTAKN
jgi:mannose-6-phosphate isomerase-like protein (cupin superfamily)